jgi:MFS superfamily sulfate permease-like transporter
MFAAASKLVRRFALFRAAPPHLFGAAAGAGLAIALGLAAQNPALFIDVPANPLDGLTMPAFGALAAQPDLWWAAFVGVVTLTLIDGVESLATAQAVDRIDPFHRKSEPSRVLLAMGLSNVVSSLVGGLTVIPGGVKSKTNIEAGGRTLWANFVNAGFLLVFLFVAPGLVALLPKAALGAILVYTGWKMIDPAIARHLEHVGREQVVFYGVTIVAILATDLLVGILIGTGVKLAYVAWHTARAAPGTPTLGATLRSLFQDPVGAVDQLDEVSVLHIDKPVVCFNAYRLVEHVDELHAQGKTVKLTLEDGAVVLDHTSLEGLAAVGASLEGGDGLVPSSSHATALRHAPKLAG